MSETKTGHSYPHHKSEKVSISDLRDFIAEHPELYPGILGEAATKMVAIESPSNLKKEQGQKDDNGRREILDKEGWSRLVLNTPADGVKVMFKGRHDIPVIETIGHNGLLVSLRPLYHDEPTGLMGGIRSEQQISYAGSHGSDPRLIMQPGGVMTVVERALQEAGGKDLVFICDETPQGMRALFQAIGGLVDESELSELAIKLSSTEYSGLVEPSEEINSMFSEISVELTAALKSNNFTPHEALELVFLAHVGPKASREMHLTELNKMIEDSLKRDHLGGSEPEVHHQRKAKLVEALNSPERQDYWVHRDLGILRPSDRILTGGSYVDYPRHTTHGCLNVAIDVEKNIYGSGGHGVSGGKGTTTIASPMGRFVEVNGMPVNLEAADTYFVNHHGLVIPDGSLFVTISPDSPPEDLSSSEVWLPLTISDEDIKNGVLQDVAGNILQSLYSTVLNEEEKSTLLRTIERMIREVDESMEVQLLASSAIVDDEIERIRKKGGSTEEQARLEYFDRVQKRRFEFEKLVVIDGVELQKFPYAESAKQDAVRIALDRLTEEFRIFNTGLEFSLGADGGLSIPLEISERNLTSEELDVLCGSVSRTTAFKKLSPNKQDHFIQALSAYFRHLPSNQELIDQHESGYGYSHGWGYEVDRKANELLHQDCNELAESTTDGRNDIHVLYERAKNSDLATSLANGEKLNLSAAVLAIHKGGSNDDVKAYYYEIIRESQQKAAGYIRSEKLRDWLAYNIIDQDELRHLYTVIMDTNLAKARSQRRSDFLQVWLVNTFVSKKRNKPTPKLESFGRGLDWDVPGAMDQIRMDYNLAESVGVETLRHADSAMSTNENILYSELKKIKEEITKDPSGVNYAELIKLLKGLPLGLAARYVRAGIISFDQHTKKSEITEDTINFG